MSWFRVPGLVFQLCWPHLLTPWRSPLLRWRLETYGVCDPQGRLLHADELSPSYVLTFTWHHRRAICRFLRWAATL